MRCTNELVEVAPDDGVGATYQPLRLIRSYFTRHYVIRALEHFDRMITTCRTICEDRGRLDIWLLKYEDGKYLPFQVRVSISVDFTNLLASRAYGNFVVGCARPGFLLGSEVRPSSCGSSRKWKFFRPFVKERPAQPWVACFWS